MLGAVDHASHGSVQPTHACIQGLHKVVTDAEDEECDDALAIVQRQIKELELQQGTQRGVRECTSQPSSGVSWSHLCFGSVDVLPLHVAENHATQGHKNTAGVIHYDEQHTVVCGPQLLQSPPHG